VAVTALAGADIEIECTQDGVVTRTHHARPEEAQPVPCAVSALMRM
jgi:hypothetical protein